MMPISSPPLLPPWAPSCSTVVIPRSTRSAATAAKSSSTRCRPSPHRLGVPARPVLAAAADVGQHVRAAARQPQPAQHPAVGPGCVEILEAAVAAQQRRARSRAAMPDARSTGSGCRRRTPRSAASPRSVGASKNAGALLDLDAPRRRRGPSSSRDGASKPLESRKISSPYVVGVDHDGVGVGRDAERSLRLPGARGDDLAPGSRRRRSVTSTRWSRVHVYGRQAGVLVGLEHARQMLPCPPGNSSYFGGQQRARRVGASAHGPVGAGPDQQPLAVQRRCRRRSARRSRISSSAAQLVAFAVEEVERPADQQSARSPACRVAPTPPRSRRSAFAREQRLRRPPAACRAATA